MVCLLCFPSVTLMVLFPPNCQASDEVQGPSLGGALDPCGAAGPFGGRSEIPVCLMRVVWPLSSSGGLDLMPGLQPWFTGPLHEHTILCVAPPAERPVCSH